MGFDIINFCCMIGCCKYNFYSKKRVFGVLKKMDKNYLSTLRSDKIPFSDYWTPRSAYNKELQYILKHKLYYSLKTLNLPISSLDNYFDAYFDIQMAYFIFEIITNTYLDIKEQKNIKYIPLLDIPIQNIFYYIPTYDKNKIDIIQHKFYQIKGKKIDMNTKISIMDKILLDFKLEILIKDILRNVNFTFFIEKIYHEYNNQLIQFEEKQKLEKNKI